MEPLADGLRDALDGATDVVVVYTDLSRVPRWFGSRQDTLQGHADALLTALEGRTVVVPTFNYDWCQTGRYEPDTDPAQVGALNEYLRVHHATRRTWTPVFNFALLNEGDASLSDPVSDPFGRASVFWWLIREKATVLAYGAPLHNASALHVTEREMDVPYRYFKPFRGHIEGHGAHNLVYFVRPSSVEYDWTKVDDILAPVFTEHDLAPGTIHVGRADRVHQRLKEALSEDEHAFLAEPPTELYRRYGRPLTYGRMEKVA